MTGPCDDLDICPKYSVCKDSSTATVPKYTCTCTMGYIMAKGACVSKFNIDDIENMNLISIDILQEEATNSILKYCLTE